MKRIALIMTLALLAGCAGIQSAVDAYGAEAADSTVTAAEWTICYAAPVGTIRKKYGDPERAAAWNRLCSGMEFDIADGESAPAVTP